MKRVIQRFSSIVVVLLACASVCYGDGAINLITVHRGLGSGMYECGINFNGTDIEQIQLTMPWGETVDTNDLLPGDWAGEYVESGVDDGSSWFDFEASGGGF